MKTIKPFRLSTLYRPYSWRGQNRLSVALFALADMKTQAAPKLLSDIELWREVLPDLDCDGVLDHVLPKVIPEFLVGGYAYTAHQSDKTQLAVRVQVGGLEKELIVFGDRYWLDNKITAPQSFEIMPVTWANAFGGAAFADNPSGKGLDEKTVNGIKVTPLPNVENKQNRVSKKGEFVQAHGMGPVNLLLPRRFNLQGTYSEQWRTTEFPGFFPDLNPEMFNAAEPDQRWTGRDGVPLGEPFRIWNMHPHKHCWQGQIPDWHGRCFIRQKINNEAVFKEVPLKASTVWFVPHQERLLLIYHGSIQVAEDDASDVLTLMSALETPDAQRPEAHYRKIMDIRSDPEKGGLHVLCDDELIPAAILGDINIDIEAVYQTPSWIKAQNRKQKMYAEQRAFITEAGKNPDDYLPEMVGPERRYRVTDLPELMEQNAKLEDEAQALKTRMQADFDKQKAHYKAQGVEIPDIPDIADMMDMNQPSGVSGPPKALPAMLDALKQVNANLQAGLPDLTPLAPFFSGSSDDLKISTAKLPDIAKEKMAETLRKEDVLGWVNEPKFQRQMGDLQPLLRKSYLYSVQYQDGVARIGEHENETIRRQVQEKFALDRDLSMLDLTGADLSGMHFENASFHGCFMEGTDLRHARFINCDMSGCVLARADMRFADFTGSNFSKSNVCMVNTEKTVFDKVLFKEVVLERTVFNNSFFKQAVFDTFIPDKLKFEYCSFEETRFSMVIFNELSVSNCVFPGAVLFKTSFQSSGFVNVSFEQADFDSCSFFISQLEKCVFSQADIKNTAFIYHTFLRQCSFSGATLKQCNFRETSLLDNDFRYATLNRSDFSLADMSGVSLRNSNCRDSSFIRTKLEGADFTEANLISADFKAARLSGACLSRANLFRANVGLAILDGKTGLQDSYTKQTNIYPLRKEVDLKNAN